MYEIDPKPREKRQEIEFWKEVYIGYVKSGFIPEACNKKAAEAVNYLREFEKGEKNG